MVLVWVKHLVALWVRTRDAPMAAQMEYMMEMQLDLPSAYSMVVWSGSQKERSSDDLKAELRAL